MADITYLVIHCLQLLGLFTSLTCFGAGWKGAERQGRKGWLVAFLGWPEAHFNGQ